jgi:DNA gyrase subunit A
LPALPAASGMVHLSGGMPAREVAALDAGERIVGIAPIGVEGVGVALGTRAGVVKVAAPDWPTRSDTFEIIGLKDDDEVLSAAWVTGGEELVFISSDTSLLHFPVSSVRPQGRTGAGMAGIKLAAGAVVVGFAAVAPGEPGAEGEAMVVTGTGVTAKVTPLAAYPGKGRATGGVRAHKLLKGEEALVVGWVGANPVAATEGGEPVSLPAVDARRDGSGAAVDRFGMVGSAVSR